MPMFLTRRDPDHITRANCLKWTSPTLHQATARRHDQGLAQRVGVPGGSRAGLECDTDAARACRSGWLEQWISAYRTGKVLDRSFARRLRAAARDAQCLRTFTCLVCL